MIRTIWVLVGGGLLTLVYASRVVLRASMGRPDMPCACDRLASTWSKLLLRMSGVRVRIHGEDRADWSRSAVVVANHQSWFDVFTMAAFFPGRPRFVAKEELGRIPIFGRAWKTCGHISIDRSNRRRAIESLDRAAERVRQESLTMILFPEGTRSPDGELHAFKKGAFVLAIKSGVPIIPVGISGSRQVMPKGSWKVRPGEIHIWIGEPISVEDLGHADREGLRERSRSAVAELLAGTEISKPEEANTSQRKETSE